MTDEVSKNYTTAEEFAYTIKKLNHFEKSQEEVKNNLSKAKSDLKEIKRIIYFALLIAVVTLIGAIAVFIIGFSEITRDNIGEKEIFNNYNDKFTGFREVIFNQQIEISNLRKEIELLLARNPYLK